MIKKTTYKCEYCPFETDDYDKMVEHEKFPCQLFVFSLNLEPYQRDAGVIISYEQYPFKDRPGTFKEGIELIRSDNADGPTILRMQIRENDEATAYNKFIKAVEEWFIRKMKQTNVCISRLNDKGLNIKKLELPVNELTNESR